MSDSVDFVRGLKKQISENLRVSSLATIVSFDPVAMKANVQPLEPGLPLISDCPVAFPHSSDYFVRVPLKPGDQVMVVFNDYALDGSSKARHRIDDAVVIAGINLSGAPADHSEDLVIAKKDMTVKIVINDQGVTVESQSQPIEVKNQSGAINLSNQSGAINVGSSSGDVNISSELGDVNITSSAGNVNIAGKDSSGSW